MRNIPCNMADDTRGVHRRRARVWVRVRARARTHVPCISVRAGAVESRQAGSAPLLVGGSVAKRVAFGWAGNGWTIAPSACCTSACCRLEISAANSRRCALAPRASVRAGSEEEGESGRPWNSTNSMDVMAEGHIERMPHFDRRAMA
jgi:hypothetical protein